MKICLCGSTKFKPQWEEANLALTMAGHVVYSVASMSHADGIILTKSEKDTLDLVHKMKILHSDAVVIVTDESGYYGDSTKSELQWAEMLGKPIYPGWRIVERAFSSMYQEGGQTRETA